MKILVVTRGYPQTHNKMMGLFERDQARALLDAGHDVAYAVVDIRSFRRKRKFGYNHYIIDRLKIYEMNYPLGPMPRFLIEYFRKLALRNLYKHIKKDFGKPDIVHAHFLNYGVISVPLCKNENIPLVITEHSSYLNKPILKKNIYKRALKAYKASDALISVSSSFAKNLKKTTGFDSVVIPNIVSFGEQKAAKMKEFSKNRRFKFVSAGYLLSGKGFDVLINAFNEVIEQYSNAELTILGDGPEKEKLIKQTHKLGLDKYIHFYGAYLKEDLTLLFNDADAFVLASKGETFGVVYIEAMACGLPVIATKCGGPEDIIDETNGYLVPKDDVQQLSQAMLKMIRNASKFDRSKIMQDASEKYSSERIAAMLTQVFEEILI